MMKNTGAFTGFLALLLLTSLVAATARAVPPQLTYQGRILQPSGQPINSNGVLVTVRILAPNPDDCVLLEETHTVDFNGKDGNFSVGIGAGIRSGDDAGLTMDQVFSNAGTRSGLTCTTGSTYTPDAIHNRKMFINFDDNGTLVNFTDPYLVRSVPYALESKLVSGFSADNLCRVADAGVPQTAAALTSANFTELLALINGSSAQYSRTSTVGGTQLSVDPSTPTNGSVWIDSSTGVLKYRHGGTTKTIDVVPSSTVTTGTYTSVTVDAAGRVTAGTNPTTIAGHGITDGVVSGGQTGAITIGPSDANALTLQTAGSTRMTVLSTGNVGIGTTNPGSLLTLSDTAGNPTLSIGPTQAAAGGAATLRLVGKNGGSSSTAFLQSGWTGAITYQAANGTHTFLDGGGVTRLHLESGNLGIGITPSTYKLDVNGDVRIASASKLYFGANTEICSSTGCVSPSDRRYKKNVEWLEHSLDKIQQLHGVSYEWIDQETFGDQPQIGLIAQDLEKVYPEVVRTDSKSGMKTVMYDKLVAPLIESVKVLATRLNATDDRLAQLEAKNAQLKAYVCSKEPTAPICR